MRALMIRCLFLLISVNVCYGKNDFYAEEIKPLLAQAQEAQGRYSATNSDLYLSLRQKDDSKESREKAHPDKKISVLEQCHVAFLMVHFERSLSTYLKQTPGGFHTLTIQRLLYPPHFFH